MTTNNHNPKEAQHPEHIHQIHNVFDRVGSIMEGPTGPVMDSMHAEYRYTKVGKSYLWLTPDEYNQHQKEIAIAQRKLRPSREDRNIKLLMSGAVLKMGY